MLSSQRMGRDFARSGTIPDRIESMDNEYETRTFKVVSFQKKYVPRED